MRFVCKSLQTGQSRFAMLAVLGLLVMALVGCKGIDPSKSPSASFAVDIPVKTAFDRAVAQTKFCLVTEDRFPMTAEIAPDGQSAFVRVNMTMAGTLLSDVRIAALPGERSQVDVQMWGVNVWDMTAVDAMKAAIEFGVPSCVNYFPSATQVRPRR